MLTSLRISLTNFPSVGYKRPRWINIYTMSINYSIPDSWEELGVWRPTPTKELPVVISHFFCLYNYAYNNPLIKQYLYIKIPEVCPLCSSTWPLEWGPPPLSLDPKSCHATDVSKRPEDVALCPVLWWCWLTPLFFFLFVLIGGFTSVIFVLWGSFCCFKKKQNNFAPYCCE